MTPHIHFADYTYFPALRTRPAELTGYSKLSEGEKQAVVPLVTIGSWNSRALWDESVTQLKEAIGSRRFFLDVSKEPAHATPEMRALLSSDEHFGQWRSFSREFPNAIPIIQTRGARLPRVIQQVNAFSQAGRQVAFRITDAAEETSSVAAALASLPDPSSAMVFVDLGYIRDSFLSYSVAAAEVINSIRDDIEDADITVMSSSFPSSPFKFADPDSQGRRGIISMQERSLQLGLGGQDVCNYGDYASIHPRVYPATGGRFSCRIDYPLDDSWVFERRTDCNSDGYIDCAQSLLARYPEIASDQSWGAGRIRDAASGLIEGMKIARQWTAARVNMHLARQIRLSEAGAGQLLADDLDEE